jgi:ankyrin repeat protein
MARERGYTDIVAIIEQEEQRRREENSCPNATVSPVQDQINEAISSGDNAEAIRLLEADKSLIQACDREGGTPLHIAAQVTNVEMVAWLLRNRANARKEDIRGFTPLDRAALAADPRNHCAEGFRAVAKLLLEHRAEMTVRGGVALADAPRVRELVLARPDVLREIRWTEGGLLSLAVKHGHVEIVRLLLDLGADVDERTLLQELDEPVLSWGTPLWYASLAGRRDIVELLLDRGADPNANVYASGWPLRNAWNLEDQSVKRLLLERGAKLQPYMVSETHDVAEAKRLLKADPSEGLARELTWSAADAGCPEIVELALAQLRWPPGDPQWHWILIQPIRGIHGSDSQREDFFKCLSILLGRVDANVSRFGATALHFTAAHHRGLRGEDRARFAAMLIDHGARMDIRDELLQSTPLAWACRWGRKELVEMLISRGASVVEADAEPWATPKAWAAKMGHEDILAMLEMS